MPLRFHGDRPTYFQLQAESTRRHVIPFIASEKDLAGRKVLEIGCGEGGNLKPFLDLGCTCVGVDLNESKINYAHDVFSEAIASGQANFQTADIYNPQLTEAFSSRFDLILLKDVIEHIHGQERLLRLIRTFLAPGGMIFLGFPPWRMPFGGHQQTCRSHLGKLPWYHLLPRPIYRQFLIWYGEPQKRIENLMEIADTRISIQRFERLAKQTGYTVKKRAFYLVNPGYEIKFGLKPRKQLPILRTIPWVRDFVTTAAWYLISSTTT